MTTVTSIHESSTPPRHVVPSGANVTDDLAARVARSPAADAFARKEDDGWRTVTWAAFARQVTALAARLMAAGIQPGDRVAVLSGTRYEWVLCDFATWTAGAVTVPIYETSSAQQVAWILSDSGAVAAFVEDDRRRELIERANSPFLRLLWTIEGGGLDRLPLQATSDEVERRRRAVTAPDPATIVYTSGTTGRPKGCVLSHANLLAEVRNVALAEGVSDLVLTEGSSILLFLPLAHIFARVVQLAAVHNGVLTAHTNDLANVAATLRDFRPSLVLAVPRVFEKFANTARRKAIADGHGSLFQAAEDTAVAYSTALDRGQPSPWLRAKRLAFDRLVYAKLRAALGGRVRWAVCGGAPLSARLGHFLRGIGITVLEGYGLTETTAGITLNLPTAQRIGTVGRPLPGCAVRIAEDGEVQVRGPVVFGGYWHNDAATRDAFTKDGWLRTGDLGDLDGAGYLTITGRAKGLIVTAGGKNVAPAPLEDRLRAHWLIDHCVLVGDDRPYVGALITIDLESFEEWKAVHRKPFGATVGELRADTQLLASIQLAVDDANQLVSHAEAIKRFRIMPTSFAVSDELTPTQKVRRDYVLAKFADEVDALYAGVS